MDQTINRPFVGRRAVTIKHLNGTTNVNNAGETVCSHYGSNNYTSNDQLPEKLTLGWYTADICKSLPPGFYMATTIMHIEVVNFLQPKYVINESNIFEIKE